MMSKLQQVINHMDVYRTLYIKRAFLAWKGAGGGGLKKSICTDSEIKGIPICAWSVLDDCHITSDGNFAIQDYYVSLCVLKPPLFPLIKRNLPLGRSQTLIFSTYRSCVCFQYSKF